MGDIVRYDEIGNPKTYRDGIAFTWTNGRQLKKYTKGSTNITYTYDNDGMRLSKQIGNSLRYKYLYNGGNLVQETVSDNILDYFYDANDRALAVRYKNNLDTDGTYYYYAYNSRGDIVGLNNADGTIYCTYSYDAWGNILSVKNANGVIINSAGDIANLQSLKYRGYVYDNETGLYYLQSRYYDPVTHRFINADGYISTGQGIIGNNVFVYCDNNPVLNVDFNGYRYCEATTVRDENKENRKISCQFRSNRIIDITNRLNSAMINNAQTLREKLNAVRQISRYSGTDLSFVVTFDFIDRVRPNGEWDFKSQEEWNLSPNYLYQYNNHILRYDDIGNIHYGYVGRELFSTNALLWAGGVVQVCTGTSKWEYWQSCFDDPRDQEMIYFGSQLWDMNS